MCIIVDDVHLGSFGTKEQLRQVDRGDEDFTETNVCRAMGDPAAPQSVSLAGHPPPEIFCWEITQFLGPNANFDTILAQHRWSCLCARH